MITWPTKKISNYVEYFKQILANNDYCYHVGQLYRYLSGTPLQLTPTTIKQYWSSFILECFQKHNTYPDNIDFYIHIPFCKSRCSYCLYECWPIIHPFTIDLYIDYLIKTFNFYKDIFDKVTFRNLYCGGGTPSIMSSTQLKKLLKHLFKNFKFSNSSQRCFECNPDSINKDKFKLLRSYGFNRVSFGIQTMNKESLAFHRRKYQSKENINRILRMAEKIGFEDISVDLILGLGKDNLLEFKKTFLEVVSLKPYNIVVYGLMPKNDDYIRQFLKMDKPTFFKSYYPDIVAKGTKIMRGIANEFGYLSDCDPAKFWWSFRHKDALPSCTICLDASFHKTESTFGLGTFSRSHIFKTIEYQQTREAQFFNPNSQVYTGWKLNETISMIKYIVTHIDLTCGIQMDEFKTLFGKTINEAFPDAVAALNNIRKIKIRNGRLNLIIQKPQEKYIYTLFFLHFAGINLNQKL